MNYINPIEKQSNHAISIRLFIVEDIPLIVSHFAQHHWPKPAYTFEAYLDEQKHNERIVWLAFYHNEFTGYATLKKNS